MIHRPDTRIALAALGGADCSAVLAAMKSQGWSVGLTDSLDGLVAMVDSGSYHVAVVACADPHELPREAAASVISLQADNSVLFLVPDRGALADWPALTGTTSDHVLELRSRPEDFIAVVKTELASVLANQPEYTIISVDDDAEFLASLEEFLPGRIEEAFPRFAMDFQFYTSPLDALEACNSPRMRSDQLAVVISDQMMPEMKGVDMLRQIRKFCPRSLNVLLTGHAGIDSAVVAINEQVLDRYLVKPIEHPADFANTIRQLVREHHLRRIRDAQRCRLMSQFEFIRSISTAADIGKALGVTVGFLRHELRARQVMVLLLEKQQLAVRASTGLATDEGNATAAVFDKVLHSQRPITIARTEDLPKDLRGWRLSAPLAILPLSFCKTQLGVLVVAGAADERPFTRDEQRLTSFVADAASVTIGGLRDRLTLEQHYLDTMASLMEAVEAKDLYTRGHTDRVRDLTVKLAKAAGLTGRELADVERAAALHDIGKIAVPDSVIGKAGRLSPEEYACVKEHSNRGDRILQHLNFLDVSRAMVRSHHERWDGKGYPDALAGRAIPLGARILAITDSYDAMTSARPYRQAMEPAEALAEIEVNAGTQFDPELVRTFLALMKDVLGPAPLRPQAEIPAVRNI